MPETPKGFVSKKQGDLSPEDIVRLKKDLSSFADEKADGNGIFFEGMLSGAAATALDLLNRIKEKLGSASDDVMPQILFSMRELAARRGLVGGHEKMSEYAKLDAPKEQRQVDKLSDPLSQEDGVGYRQRVSRIETFYSLVALATLEESTRERILGMVMATYLDTDPKIAEDYIDVKEDKLTKLISEKTPSYHLLSIVEFCEQDAMRDLPVCKDAKFAAMEFLRRRLGNDYRKGLEGKRTSVKAEVILKKEDVSRLEKDLANFANGNRHDKNAARIFFSGLLRDGAASALRFVQDTERLSEGVTRAVSEVLEHTRHNAYASGVFGGYENIKRQSGEDANAEQAQEGIKKGTEKGSEDGESYASRMRRIRAFYSLLGLHIMDEKQRAVALGKVNASFGPQIEKAAKYIDVENGILLLEISEQTPLDDLLSCISVTENEKISEQDVCKKAHDKAMNVVVGNLVTIHEGMRKVACEYFKLRHVEAILNQMPDTLSDGRIGGKSAGNLLAYAALEQENKPFEDGFAVAHGFKNAEELHKALRLSDTKEMKGRLKQNVSYFIGSRIFEDVMRYNVGIADTARLKRYYAEGKKAPEELHARVDESIKKAEFPPHILRQLRSLFEKFHGNSENLIPIIARSSSELEDRIGAAFAGKYESVELANSGDFESDFAKFLDAIREIYASVFRTDVMSYRKMFELLSDDEEMGVLVQHINGEKHGDYFGPDFAGVGYSFAARSRGEDPRRGCFTVVAGLGEQAVKNDSCSRLVMLANPRATYGKNECQNKMSVMDLKAGKKIEIDPYDITGDNLSVGMKQFGGNGMSYGVEHVSVNCDALVNETDRFNVPLLLEYIVQKLKTQLGFEVDCEFTMQVITNEDGDKDVTINLVQCRPHNIPKNLKPSHVPENVEEERYLFKGMDSMDATCCSDLTHIVYVDPSIFAKADARTRLRVREYVDLINGKFEGKKGSYLIMAPRRWGSEDREGDSGLDARLSDFNNAGGVMEVFGGERNRSSGNHFGQDFFDSAIAMGALLESEIDIDFIARASHSNDMPEVPAALREFVKVVDVNAEYEKHTGKKAENGWCLHLAQTNIGESDKSRIAGGYFAEKGADVPEPVKLD